MSEVEIGRLVEVGVREAWRHEARSFTPWLAEHLGELGEKLGIPLELESTEVAVEGFSADILARNPLDDTRVLIENQLEATDHSHLGQILTYLTGLGAQTVVWIATSFREPHLSAIQWLNEHTLEPFSFFAVRLRLVRIGSSPVAPIFEVLGQPNNWDRQLQEKTRQSRGLTELGQRRRAFWDAYFERYPDDLLWGKPPGANAYFWREVWPEGMILSPYRATDRVGLFVRPRYGGDPDELYRLLEAHAETLSARLGVNVSQRSNGHFLGQTMSGDVDDPAAWSQLHEWLHETTEHYFSVLREVIYGESPGSSDAA